MRNIFEFLLKKLALLALIGGLAILSSAQTTYVDHTNNKCDRADGTQGRPYRLAADGLSKAREGGQLEIRTGVYNELLTISKKVTIASSGGPARIGLVGSRKVCQLLGEDDREVCGRNTKSQTRTNYQLNGADLGVPVGYKGRIYFLFGDTASANSEDGKQPYNPSLPRSKDSDSIAWVPDSESPEECLKLRFLKEGQNPGNEESPGKYRSPRVVIGTSGLYVSLGTLEVPTGAFSVKDAAGREKMYAFFTTSHLTDAYEMGQSFLARLEDEEDSLFSLVSYLSCRPNVCPDGVGKFINVSPVVVNNASLSIKPDVAAPGGRGVLLWGSGAFRKSDVYLAYFPLDDRSQPDLGQLRYWNKDQGWVANESEATELFKQPQPQTCKQEKAPFREFCGIGELSVTWNPFLNKWLMLYNHGKPEGINYRVADNPWGPWEDRGLLFDPYVDGGFCHFIHEPGCDTVRDYDAREDDRGEVYGPYVIPQFTKSDATTTTIYWTMSTWNPYQVVLMKSALRLSDAQRVDR